MSWISDLKDRLTGNVYHEYVMGEDGNWQDTGRVAYGSDYDVRCGDCNTRLPFNNVKGSQDTFAWERCSDHPNAHVDVPRFAGMNRVGTPSRENFNGMKAMNDKMRRD